MAKILNPRRKIPNPGSKIPDPGRKIPKNPDGQKNVKIRRNFFEINFEDFSNLGKNWDCYAKHWPKIESGNIKNSAHV